MSPILSTIDSTCIEVNLPNLGKTCLAAAYHPPHKVLDPKDLKKIFSINAKVILAGDLNAKSQAWNSQHPNTAGNVLEKFASTNNIFISAPTEPTHFPPSGRNPDVIDILALKNIPTSHSIITINDLTSDHVPVLAVFDTSPLTSPVHPITKTKTDWDKYSQLLDQAVFPVVRSPDIPKVNQIIQDLESTILSAIKEASHPVNNNFHQRKLPEHIRSTITTRNRARKTYQNVPTTENKRALSVLNTKVKNLIKNYRNQNWNSTLQKLSTKDNSLWRLAKVFHTHKSFPSSIQIPNSNDITTSKPVIANIFADILEHNFATPTSSFSNVSPLPPMDTERISPTETMAIVRFLPKRKAPGPDGITNQALSLLPNNAIVHLTDIFNALLDLNYFPENWKHSRVITIHKKGKSTLDPNNYRPISLLSSIGKTFEKILHRRIMQHCNENSIIPPYQFGFVKKHSATHQLHRIVETIHNSWKKDLITGIVFLDVAKAFDKVWHSGLLTKLERHNFPPYLRNTIQSYLTDRTFFTDVQGNHSSIRPIHAGIPQGSIIAPTLFNIFTADFPSDPAYSIAQFADDTAIIASYKYIKYIHRSLQDALSNIERWCDQWNISINPSKSQFVIFKRSRYIARSSVPPPLRMYNETIPLCKQVKYLGVTLHNKLNWSMHIKNIVKKAKASYFSLYPLLVRSSKLSLKNKLTLFKSFLLPQVLYACPIWGHSPQIKKIQTLQNIWLRRIANADWYISNNRIAEDLQITTIKDTIIRIATKFFDKSGIHTNPIIANINNYQTPAWKEVIPRTKTLLLPQAQLMDLPITSDSGDSTIPPSVPPVPIIRIIQDTIKYHPPAHYSSTTNSRSNPRACTSSTTPSASARTNQPRANDLPSSTKTSPVNSQAPVRPSSSHTSNACPE